MFITDKFLLDTDFSEKLYREHAEKMPVIDYHNHLEVKKIAEDHQYNSITELWLAGDHYKWRALRANGIDEHYITGTASDYEKFLKWAQTVPYTMRNPLYHWTHLELLRYFDIKTLLNEKSAKDIYETCNALLKEQRFSVHGLLRKMNVKALCTTDDPVDSLQYHKQIAHSGFEIKVTPTWRPDKVMAVENPTEYVQYIEKLGESADIEIRNFNDLLTALSIRQSHFSTLGCRLSDHGLSEFPSAQFTHALLEKLFAKLCRKEKLDSEESRIYKTGMLYYLASMNHEMGWTQQFHIGAIRNNNRRLFKQLGPDVGCDSIADKPVANAMSDFFGRLDEEDKLAKTIVYNLNPKDSDVIMSMLYNFNDGKTVGKMQYGAAWWFLDQKDGIQKQLEVLSNGGLLSRFVGMLTDSRSFLSFSRHEYFRRILCNLLGNDIQKGHLPASEIDFIGSMVEDICYNNAQNYLKL